MRLGNVYTEKPDDFNSIVEVSACFCQSDQEYLFLKRHPDTYSGYTWGLPGGKIESGETPLDGVVREIFEETGIILKENNTQFLRSFFIRYPTFDFIYHLYQTVLEVRPNNIILSPQEHLEFIWVTLEKALELHLISGEAECIHLLFKAPIQQL
ncbi:MAG: NUDIX hydrolase [Parachlamydiales bacterium]|nr:NUDIX hydrolase [Parachlamydiales bacterium]